MKGEKIVDERISYVYTADCFVFAIPQKMMVRMMLKYKSKGIGFVESKLGDVIQRRMKKLTDEVLSGDVWQKDFEDISKWCLADIKEKVAGTYGKDLKEFE